MTEESKVFLNRDKIRKMVKIKGSKLLL